MTRAFADLSADSELQIALPMFVFPLLFLEVLLLALVLDGAAPRRRLAIPLATLGLVLPWLLPASWIGSRALVGLTVVWLLATAIDFVRRPEAMGVTKRIWCLTSPFDARNSKVVGKTLSVPLFATALLWLPLSVGGLALAFANHDLLSRWLGGAVGFYCSVELVTRIMEATYLTRGIAIPKTQDHPICSRSISEFWGRRWNRYVGRWLRFHCFLPFARRGHARLGIAIAFVASGFLHFYFILTSLGARLAFSMAAFFVLQFALIQVESLVRLRERARWVAHAWSIAALVLLSPLFIEPLLQIMEASRLPFLP